LATLSDGRARLSLATWPLAGIARLENLEVDVPGPAAADDGAPLPPERLRNRRGRLVEATVTTDLELIARELERPGMRARLAAAGISDVRAGLSEGAFRLVGRASMGDREAPFTARARLDRAVPRRPGVGNPAVPRGIGPKPSARIRLSIEDLRIYGFLPVPAPIVARAILSSLVQARPGTRWWIDFDPLEAALLETFAAHGWRLPDAGDAWLKSIEIAPQRIALGWSGAPAEQAGPSADTGDAAPPAEATRWETPDLDEADGLLARGDHRGALDAYRRALKRQPDGPAVTRVLEVLVSSAAHLEEADELASEILTRQSDEPLPLLVRAVAAAERGDPALAADTYEQIATIERRRNEDEDVVIARLAAAEQWLRAEKTDRARRLADQVLATMPAHASGETARLLQILGDRLVARGELAEADQVYESRLALATDRPTRDALAIERSRARLLAPDGVPGALAVLGAIPFDTASREALELRADLGERQVSPDDAVPALDELVARARRAGDEEAARRFEERASQLLARVDSTLGPSEGPRPPALRSDGGAVSARLDLESNAPDAPSILESASVPPSASASASASAPPSASADAEDLERLLLTNPTDAAAAESLAEIYARIGEPRERADALSSLLRRALGLSPDRRKAIYASLGESAEASGDLDRAEQAYWRAATIEAEPALRASFLVSHARVLLARGEAETAIGELEEALARVPDHAGALALLGDLAFRGQDWRRARQIYASLAASPGAAEVISRELLIYRRAQVAQAIGEEGEGEAENHLRELAILNPRHVEAREALADIALRRRDFGGGALRLEEVLRLLPLDALDRLLDVRQRLGGVYLQLQDWTSARYYIELVLAQDPTRTVPLEILIDVYQRLAAYREAADACGRLARLHAGPRRRAEILYRQGEILRQFLDDESGALDAFLRAADLDPQFTPALVRLADSYWRHGALDDLAEMAGELADTNFVPDEETQDVPIRLAIATRLARRPGEPPAPVPSLDDPTGDAARRARVLAEAAAFLGARAPRTLDPAIDALAREGGSDDETSGGPANGFYRALEDLVQEDAACANMGAVRALGRAAERSGWIAAARALYSVLVFVDPSDGAAAALADLGPAKTIDPEEIEGGGMLAVLAQRQPLDALETIARADPLTAGSDRVDPARRRELLRSLPARELVSTMLSLDYQRALA
jgi:tetratricopeptide (TPR) repeat protein